MASVRRCGTSPETFPSVVYRREMPGFGARTRLAVVVGGKFDGHGAQPQDATRAHRAPHPAATADVL